MKGEHWTARQLFKAMIISAFCFSGWVGLCLWLDISNFVLFLLIGMGVSAIALIASIILHVPILKPIGDFIAECLNKKQEKRREK